MAERDTFISQIKTPMLQEWREKETEKAPTQIMKEHRILFYFIFFYRNIKTLEHEKLGVLILCLIKYRHWDG